MDDDRILNPVHNGSVDLFIELLRFGVIGADEVFFLPVREHEAQEINVQENWHSGEIKHANEYLADAFGILHAGIELWSGEFLVHVHLKHFPLAKTTFAAFLEREHDDLDQIGRNHVDQHSYYQFNADFEEPGRTVVVVFGVH